MYMLRTTTWRLALVAFAVALVLALAPAVTGRASQATPDNEAYHAGTPGADSVCAAATPVPTDRGASGMAGMGPATPGMEMADGTPGAAMMGEFDLMFIDMMIPHHETAIAMAEVALDRARHDVQLPSVHDDIVRLAEEIIASQGAEIDQMRAWRQAWYPDAPPMPMDQMTGMMGEMMEQMPGMGGMDMTNMMGMAMDPAGEIAALCAAPEPFDLAFLDAMIPHHRSAVAMAEVARQRATHPELVELAGAIVEAQQREIAQMETWRAAWYGPATPTVGAGASPAADAPARVAVTEGEMYVAAGQTVFRVGETYTFVVTNVGQIPHDLVVEPADADHDHEADHEDGANRLVSIAPGETRELTWTFPTPGAWELACRLPGHYEAGMWLEVAVSA